MGHSSSDKRLASLRSGMRCHRRRNHDLALPLRAVEDRSTTKELAHRVLADPLELIRNLSVDDFTFVLQAAVSSRRLNLSLAGCIAWDGICDYVHHARLRPVRAKYLLGSSTSGEIKKVLITVVCATRQDSVVADESQDRFSRLGARETHRLTSMKSLDK